MNNTTNLTAIVAIFIAATLVVGTFATTTTISICLSTTKEEGSRKRTTRK
jgi:hypothetical protein